VSEEEILYEALRAPLGLCIRADKAKVQRALAKLKKSDPALMELLILGPDQSGTLYLLRQDRARETLDARKS
jgi:hypothetical protein